MVVGGLRVPMLAGFTRYGVRQGSVVRPSVFVALTTYKGANMDGTGVFSHFGRCQQFSINI